MTERIRFKPLVLFIGALVMISIIEIRMIRNQHFTHYNFIRLVKVSEAILEGRAPFRAFQNRFLGPIIAKSITSFTGLSFETTCKLLIMGTLILTNLLCAVFFYDLTRNRKTALAYTGTQTLLFILLQHSMYIHIFDFFEFLIFLIFAYLIFRKARVIFFIILYAVGLLNGEAALFIAFWIILDSFEYSKAVIFSLRTKKLPQMAIGVSIIVFGVLYTYWIREFLFKSSIIESIGQDSTHAVIGNHIYLLDNLQDLLVRNWLSLNLFVTFFFTGMIVFFIRIMKRTDSDTMYKAALLCLVMLAAILVMGIVNETRVYFRFIPFLTMMWYYVGCPGKCDIHKNSRLLWSCTSGHKQKCSQIIEQEIKCHQI